MRITVVGGTWDENGGTPSGLINTLADFLGANSLFNGGRFEDLNVISQVAAGSDAVLWFPRVPDSASKEARNLKALNRKLLLVMAKANYATDHTHSFQDIMARALAQKANLVVEFGKKEDGHKQWRLLDPLGNQWCPWSDSVAVLAERLKDRMGFLALTVRENIELLPVPNMEKAPLSEAFGQVVKNAADTFHELLKPDLQAQRFLGNASFRCASGFPSFRSEDGSLIYVSQRNLDKRAIDADGFIPVGLDLQPAFDGGSKLRAYDLRMRKPSVDTPVQIRLYRAFPWAKYMLHGHVYVPGACYTDRCYPCGDLREVDEILRCVNGTTQSFALNLRGHGFIAVSEGLDFIKGLSYVARPAPEIQSEV